MSLAEQLFEKKLGEREPAARGGELGGSIGGEPQQFRRPITGMRDAARNLMAVRHARNFSGAASVEQVQDWQCGAAVVSNTQEAVPEGARGHCGDGQSSGVHLAMQLIQTIDGKFGESGGVDFCAPVGGGFQLIGNSRAVAFHLPGFAVEQQRAHGGAAHVEAYNEDAGGIVGARAGAQSHFSL